MAAKDSSKETAEPEKVAPEAEKIEAAPVATDDVDVPGAGPNEIGAVDEASQQPEAEIPAEEPAEPEQSVEDACAELGIEPDKDGNVDIELLVSLAGVNTKAPGEKHHCDAAEAVRMVRAGFAKPRA